MGYHANTEKSLMESLNRVVAKNERLETELADVKAQLADSQQRERAEVECIEEIAYQNRKFHETWVENAIDEWRGKIDRKD